MAAHATNFALIGKAFPPVDEGNDDDNGGQPQDEPDNGAGDNQDN